MLSRQSCGVFGRRCVSHHTGARDYAQRMGVEDAAADANGGPEVIGVEDDVRAAHTLGVVSVFRGKGLIASQIA